MCVFQVFSQAKNETKFHNVDKLLGKAQDLRGQEKEALGLALQFLGPEKFISLKVATKTPEQTLEILKKYEPKQ